MATSVSAGLEGGGDVQGRAPEDPADQPRPSATSTPSRRRRPRWVVNLRALPLLALSALAGAILEPWYALYGSWSAENGEFEVFVFLGVALLVGLAGWTATWCVTPLRARWPWIVMLGAAVLAPALVVDGFYFVAARQRTCEIRATNGHDDRLHSLPWPLALDCPYGPGFLHDGVGGGIGGGEDSAPREGSSS